MTHGEAIKNLLHAARGVVSSMEDLGAETPPENENEDEVKLTSKGKVYAFVRSRGALGATDDEIEVATSLTHQTASARRHDLVAEGRLQKSGLRRRTRAGRTAAVWIESSGQTAAAPRPRRPWAMALEESAELIASAAPVTWTGGTSDEAAEWEKRAAGVLEKINAVLGRKL